MRLSIYDQFVVGVVRPSGGWSKGRPIAFIEEPDKCVPLPLLLLPNDLDGKAMARYVGDKFSAFRQAGKTITLLPAPAVDRPARAETGARPGAASAAAVAGAPRKAG